MKKSFLFFTAAMAVSCGFAAGTLRMDQGSFFEGVWRTGSSYSYITPTTASVASSAVNLKATLELERGYGVSNWYYRTGQNISTTLSDWTQLTDNGGDKTGCTIPASPPFTSGSHFIALNLRYVRYSLDFKYEDGRSASYPMTGLRVVDLVTLPVVPVRDGYDGWWLAEDGHGYLAGVQKSPGLPGLDLGLANSDTNFTLIAQWTPHRMSISYDLNGGSYGADYPGVVIYGEAFKVSAPTKTGYDFKGWSVSGYDPSTAKYGTDPSTLPSTYVSSAGSACPPGGGDVWFLNLTPVQDGAITLTATWQAKTYTVNFSVSGANNNPTTSMTVTYCNPLPSVTTTPSYGNADFMGFYTQPNGQGVKYWNSDGSPCVSVWELDVNNMTFYEYKGNLRKLLTFHGNGGVPDLVITNALVGATYGSAMPSVAWAGGWYDFAGWFTSPSGGDEVSAETVIENVSGDIDLYAHWEVAKYYVRFDGNGATNAEEMAVQQIPFDAATPLSLNEYGKPGYTFTGWTNSAAIHFADGAVVSNLLAVAGTTCTVYAVWSPNEYYIRFDPNGGEGTAFVWTNRYDTATNCPPADTFSRSGYWKFSCWSNTVDSVTNAPGAQLLNLTPEPYATVVVDAVWETTLSKLSQAMHCDNLDWKSQESNSGNPWIDRWGTGLGYENSGSCASQEDRSGKGLQVGVSTNGTLSFYCRTESGDAGLARIWIASYDKDEFAEGAAYNNVYNIYTNEVAVTAGDGWTKIELEVPQCNTTNYVNIANRTRNDTLFIDMMTWTPGGSPIEPTDKDAAVITNLTVGVGGFSFAFTPDPRFAYKLHGTNELTVVRTLWPVLLSTNGSEKISFTLPIEATEPKMFYYLETIAK